MMTRAGIPWEFLEMEELEYELTTRGMGQGERDRGSMVEKLRRMVEPRHQDVGVVAAHDPEGEVAKFRGVLRDLGNIVVEGGGVVTRNKVQRLEARIRHWEHRLRNVGRECNKPALVAEFQQGLRELEGARAKIGGRCLGHLGNEQEGRRFVDRLQGDTDSDVELQEVAGRSVRGLEEGAVGGVGWMELGHNGKKSPVGSYLVEGRSGMETNRPSRWRNVPPRVRVKEELKRVEDWRQGNSWYETPGE